MAVSQKLMMWQILRQATSTISVMASFLMDGHYPNQKVVNDKFGAFQNLAEKSKNILQKDDPAG